MRVRRQRGKLCHHGVGDRHPTRSRAQRDHVPLGRGREIDEYGDEDQDRIGHQPDKAKREGDELTNGSSNLSCAYVTETGRQQGTKHPPAIHWKCRDHVEQRQKKIDRCEAIDERDARIVYRRGCVHLQVGTEQIHQYARDHDVDQRPCDRDQELFPRLFRNAFQLRHAAYRQ